MSLLDSLKPRESVELPLVYVRDMVVFPHALAPLFASTRFSVGAVDAALAADKRVFVSMLKDTPDDKSPDIRVQEFGTVARVLQQVRLPDGSSRLLVEGEARARLRKTVYRKEWLGALVETLPEDDFQGPDADALVQVLRRDFSVYADLVKKIPGESVQVVNKAEDPRRLCDLVSHALQVNAEKKQELLAILPMKDRMEALAVVLALENEQLTLQKRITQKVRARIDRSQKEYFLQEQIKEINKELGKEGEESEQAELERQILSKSPPEEVVAKARKELARLQKLQPLSPEAGVLRTYCEWIADLPWSAATQDNRDLDRARAILDEDHYGMKKAKERILEFIAVRQLKAHMKGPILCFVGAPGTGKTSLGKSVARALGRNFVRVSLGGVRDEAEIRGHRKTYVGALPGKIIQSLRKADSVNPVFLLDEIDKMSSDFRGDPASALLEVLDPEQNSTFTDHYLEVPYDLSGVMFITTANSLHNVPYPLLDRMEVIEIPGYSEYEKLEIARHFIVPKQLAENGLADSRVAIRNDAVLEIIRHYTMESGVRSLEREIAHVIRKIAQKAVDKGYARDPSRLAEFSCAVTAKGIQALLGKRIHDDDLVYRDPNPGVAYGLAWTEMGGTLLPVETSSFEGEGELILTGNLGDVMKESARAALSYIEARAPAFGLSPADFRRRTLHIHVPEGAIPKDGPSAGITLAASLLSALTGVPVLPGFAMTGEITLTGRVLPIGGVKEKLLAAHRNKFPKVLLPEGNRKDMDDVPKEVSADTELVFVSTVEEALKALFPAQLTERSRPASRRSVRPGRSREPAPAAPRRRGKNGTG